jgi:hypothetical protein
MAFTIDRPGSKVGITTTDPGPLDASSVIADYDDFTCSIISAIWTPSPSTDTVDTLGTYCVAGTTTPVPKLSTWTVELNTVQDPDDPQGLSMFLAMNDSHEAWVYVSTGATDLAPKMWAHVYVSAAAIGGEAAQPLTATATLQVTGQPMFQSGTNIITAGTPMTPVLAMASSGSADSET